MPLVALGGGDMRTGQTLPIDEAIVKLTGKAKPRALFVPTASGDPDEYCESFEIEFGGRLGCNVENLLLVRDNPDITTIRNKVFSADLVYVGGGSTLNLMKKWRKGGLDQILREALVGGLVLSGVSAGANCWFQYGHSDSASFFKNPRPGYYMRVSCLGLVKGTFCPHVISEGRLDDFRQMVLRYGGPGYAVDDCAALLIDGHSIKPLRCRPEVTVREFYRRKGELVEREME